MEPLELPVADSAPRERADAARNRRLIVAAAERLFAERGVENVSMECVAVEAGVGKGTVFRRFGDRAGLARALLDEREREFQDSLIRGPAPLGPGASPADRLVAFGWGLLGLLEAHGDVILAAESGAPAARCGSSPYLFYRAHVASLLNAADPGLDTDYLAHALLAPLSASLFRHLRRDSALPLDQLGEGYATLVRSLVPAREPLVPAMADR